MKGKRQKDKATQSIYKGALYDRIDYGMELLQNIPHSNAADERKR